MQNLSEIIEIVCRLLNW